MAFIRTFFLGLATIGAIAIPTWAQKAPAQNASATSAHTVATLVAEKTAIAPGEPFKLGLYLNTDVDWHTYSSPPGDTGLATEIDWHLPDGFSAGPILWPMAQTMTEEGLTVNVYKGPVLLPVMITPPHSLKIGSEITLSADVQWLECKEQCLPATGQVAITLPVEAASQIHANPLTAPLFECFAPCHAGDLKTLLAILSAFFGGMILNLMPCVFPVLGLKIMAFVSHSKKTKGKARIHGIVFTIGVLLSFWILSGLLLFFRSQGEALGWGFQLQSPAFVLFLITLLFALSLMFLGVFEIGFKLVGVGSNLTAKEGYSGSFFSGILATLVATPCTAPFMGAALGFALAHEAWVALTIFTALGLGMATPYLFFSFYPSLLQFLPHPGAWMERFKEAMAFPLLATVVWLIWVLGLQTSMTAVVWVLFALVLLAMAAWIYGRWGRPSSSTKAKAWAIGLSLPTLALCGWLSYEALTTEPTNNVMHAAEVDGIAWEPYSAKRLAQLRAAHVPVFVDFTAAWCLTCQSNFHGALSDEDVVKAFKDRGVVALIADWTRKDAEITQALSSVGRSGVPTNVFYSPDPTKPPILLPEILTETIVLEALQSL